MLDTENMLAEANKQYRQTGKSFLTDEEYEAIKGINTDSVDDYVDPKAKKFKHLKKIYSLAKVNNVMALTKFLLEYRTVDVKVKYDGLKIVTYLKIKYNNIYFDKSCTRGEKGLVGEIICSKDINPNLENVFGLKEQKTIDVFNRPFKKSKSNVLIVEGEAIISHRAFKIINERRKKEGLEPYKNSRNAVAGILRRENKTETEKFELNCVQYIVYGLSEIVDNMYSLDSTINALSTKEKDYILFNLGYNVAQLYGKTFIKDNEIFIDTCYIQAKTYTLEEFLKMMEKQRQGIVAFDIDGLVFSYNEPYADKRYGFTDHHPKSMIAYKFTAPGGWTYLRKIIYQEGRSGKYTPVALFDPITIAGSTVRRATLNNNNYIKALGLKTVNSKIYVIKANDVIPKIIKVENSTSDKDRIKLTDVCPCCGEELVSINEVMYCKNSKCPGKFNNMVLKFLRVLGVDSVALKTIDQLIEAKLIKRVTDVLFLKKEDLLKLDGFQEKKAAKIYDGIQNAKAIKFDKFIELSIVNGLGHDIAKTLANYYKNFLSMYKDYKMNFALLKSELGRNSNLSGIGPKSLELIKKAVPRLNKIYPIFSVEENTPLISKNIKKLNIVITGTLSKERSYYKSEIEKAGYKFQTSANSKTNYAVVGVNAGQNKLDGIDKYNIPVISEGELIYLCKTGELRYDAEN